MSRRDRLRTGGLMAKKKKVDASHLMEKHPKWKAFLKAQRKALDDWARENDRKDFAKYLATGKAD